MRHEAVQEYVRKQAGHFPKTKLIFQEIRTERQAMKTVALDLHDFSILNNRMDLLEQLKEHYPDFRVTLFTIPFDYEYERSAQRVTRDEQKARIHKALDWLEIVPHGVTHTFGEFHYCDKHNMKMFITEFGSVFAQDGLPMEKGFCAPNWLWNQQVVDVLDEAGWWGAVDRNQPDMLTPKRFYRYSHSIDEPFWEAPQAVLKLHGHIGLPSANNLEACLPNLLRLPSDTKWVYASELVEEKT